MKMNSPQDKSLMMFYDAQEEGDDLPQDAQNKDETVPPHEDSETEPEQEPDEDPELTALKEEIEKLESAIKMKKSSLSYTLDQVQEYSKSGYARKVAEMENMRRVRSVSVPYLFTFFVWFSDASQRLVILRA